MTIFNELEVRKIIMELLDAMPGTDVRLVFEAAAKVLESQIGYSNYDYEDLAKLLRSVSEKFS